jgi:hypothetical protein
MATSSIEPAVEGFGDAVSLRAHPTAAGVVVRDLLSGSRNDRCADAAFARRFPGACVNP